MEVEDPDSDSCAIALRINSGSFADPEDCPGLAHLLEHCLFTGSESFPEDNALTRYLDQHRGQLNAWTSSENTTFFLKVHQDYFSMAIDMFFDMLLRPLLSVEGIEKEIKAIDSEFHHKIKDEQRRVIEVQKETCNPDHPFARFSVGNGSIYRQFSPQELHNKLLTLWQNVFVAENINASVYSNTSVAVQLVSIRNYLNDIKKRTSPLAAATLQPLYRPEQLQRLIEIHTKRSHHRLVLIFNLDKDCRGVLAKSDSLLSHFLGYEGDGSLLRFWKSNGWATQVIVGTGLHGSDFLDFNLYIELSEAGLSHIQQIIHSVLFYIEMIAMDPFLEQHYMEKAMLNELAFSHQDNSTPLDSVLQLAKNLSRHSESNILYGDYALPPFSLVDTRQFLRQFKKENLRVLSISRLHKTDTVSTWYNVPYTNKALELCPVDAKFKNELQQQLALPPHNPYVPDTETVQHERRDLPQLNASSTGKLWSGIDSISSPYKGECFLSWHQPAEYAPLEQIAARKLFANIMDANLHETYYQAQLAGLHYHFYSHQHGVGLHTSGFSQKQLRLCEEILGSVFQPQISSADFQLQKDEYLNNLKSSIRNKPLNRLFTALQVLCVKASWLPEDLANATNHLTPKILCSVGQSLLQDSKLEGLIYGDWQQETVQNFISELENSSGQKKQNSVDSIFILSDSDCRSLHFPCKHNDSALVHYLQAPAKSLENQAYMMILEVMLSGFYFNWMRNEKQLGYQAGTGYMPFNEHPGVALFVQSNSASANQLLRETRECLAAFQHWLSQLPEQQLVAYKQSLARQLDKQNISFQVRCQRYWSAIAREPVDFDYEQHLASYIMGLSVADLSQWFNHWCMQGNREFSVYTAGDNGSTNDEFHSPLGDIYQFKQTAKQ